MREDHSEVFHSPGFTEFFFLLFILLVEFEKTIFIDPFVPTGNIFNMRMIYHGFGLQSMPCLYYFLFQPL